MKSNHCALFGPITNQAQCGKVRTMHDVIVADFDFWEVRCGITAMARAIPHTNTRIGEDRNAGRILDVAAA